jgi:hypothetical protein
MLHNVPDIDNFYSSVDLLVDAGFRQRTLIDIIDMNYLPSMDNEDGVYQNLRNQVCVRKHQITPTLNILMSITASGSILACDLHLRLQPSPFLARSSFQRPEGLSRR